MRAVISKSERNVSAIFGLGRVKLSADAAVVRIRGVVAVDEDAARLYFEATRWPDGPYCPLCGSFDRVKPFGGKSMGPG